LKITDKITILDLSIQIALSEFMRYIPQ